VGLFTQLKKRLALSQLIIDPDRSRAGYRRVRHEDDGQFIRVYFGRLVS
jgi:hypothetical protein